MPESSLDDDLQDDRLADGDPASPSTPAPKPRRRIDRSLLVVSLILAFGLALVVRGLAVGITGDERANLPDAIESLDPVPDAVQVLRQTQVFVDLETGYTGVLEIDGIELETVDVRDVLGDGESEPGIQVALPPATIYEGGNATLTFTPSDDAPIQQFGSGEHRVRVIYWRLADGRQRALSYSWVFNAT